MQINITGNHVEITPTLREYVNQKFDRIHRHFSQITNVHVILSIDKKFQQKAEAQLNLTGGQIVASSESSDMYAAIDLLMDKVDRQVIKHKAKWDER